MPLVNFMDGPSGLRELADVFVQAGQAAGRPALRSAIRVHLVGASTQCSVATNRSSMAYSLQVFWRMRVSKSYRYRWFPGSPVKRRLGRDSTQIKARQLADSL